MQLIQLLVTAVLLASWQHGAAGWRALDSSSDSSSTLGRGLQAMPLKTCYNDILPLKVGLSPHSYALTV